MRFLEVDYCSGCSLSVESGIASIRPAPNSGVGMRNARLEVLEKSSCRILQPGASDRPAMVNSA